MSDYTSWEAVETNAPDDYDYGWSEEVERYKAGEHSIFDTGETVRVVKLPTDNVRRRSQVQRYRSGLYRTREVKL